MKIKKQKAENCLEAAQIKNKISHLEKNKGEVTATGLEPRTT